MARSENTPPSDKTNTKTKSQTARKYLTSGGVVRDDSDDELGYEDHPWEWIYNDDDRPTSATVNEHISRRNEAGEDVGEGAEQRTPRKRKAPDSTPKRQIVGAQMGQFRCMVGDTVLLKAEGNEAWVGIVTDFYEDAEEMGEKMAHFMWFSTHKEVRNSAKKRSDYLENELYITPSFDENPLTTINGKATVLSPAVFAARYPSGTIKKGSRDYGKIFICRRGCNTRTATYTDEFVWEDLYAGPHDAYSLLSFVEKNTKATRKRQAKPQKDLEDFVTDANGDGDDGVPRTPKKRRKLDQSSATTPTSKHGKQGTPRKLMTPTSRRIVVKRPLEFTPLGTRVLSPHALSSPFQIARSQLHVSSVPASLPCREEEFSTVYSHLEAAITDGSGSCIYISGTPGTGKTATVREVVAQLNASVAAEELDDFIFVEINGMKVTDPHQAYSLLWEALRGDRVSPAHALELLEREFSTPSPRRVPCVVLMDELDQLVTKSQSVMYNFFNWPGLRYSRLIVLAVANTMDLPERTLSNKISSRLGLTRITFPGYSHDQLISIIRSRLENVPGNLVHPDAIQFAARKVAAVSGDARRALDICRRAVELAETETQQQPQSADGDPNDPDGPAPDTPSRRKRKDKTGGASGAAPPTPAHPQPRQHTVTIATIKRAIAEATSSPLQAALRALPLAHKLFLAALLARARRTGVAEAALGDVVDEARTLGVTSGLAGVQEHVLTEARRGPGGAGGGEAPATPRRVGAPRRNPAEEGARATAPRALGMGVAAAELAEAGVVGLEARRGERVGRVRLAVGEEEVRLALREDEEVKGLGFAG